MRCKIGAGTSPAICKLIGSARPLRGYIRDRDVTHTNPIRLVLADVDGTLVTPDKKITERTKQAVRKLAEANIGFAITSGRPPRGMAMLIEPLGLRTPIAGFNGGRIVGTDMKPIDSSTISPEYVGPIVRGLIARGLDAWVYQGDEWLVRDKAAPWVDREQSNVQFAPIVTPDLDRHVEGVVKIVGVSSDYALVEACENEARERFGDLVSAARSAARYLDITHPDANKGHVVRRIAAKLGVSTEAIATVGDMANDVLMFALSGLSIAMGQADEQVKRAARRVTTSNAEEGFAEAIERYVLKR
jgi:Cof subfamily protein (haloacid dehalogenase superfamily)